MTQVALPIDADGVSPFDAIRKVDGYGEFWTGRDLMPVMEYARWDAFVAIIEKARASLALIQGKEAASSNFLYSKKVSGARGPAGTDYRLTRFGAYLTAMAGDDTKDAVARARIYFAIRTRQAEARDENKARVEIPQTFAQALRRYADEVEAHEQTRTQLEVAAPKAAQADFHRAADGLVAVGDFANKVKAWAKGTHSVGVLHQDVWNFLGDINLLIRGKTIRHNQPTAFAIERDYVRVKATEYETNEHGTHVSTSPRLTPAGEGYAWDRAVRRIADHGSLAPIKAVAIPSARDGADR